MRRSLVADVADAAAASSTSGSPNGVLYWSQRGLERVPPELFSPAAVAAALSTSLVHLDLSFNRLESLPDAIGAFVSLRQLLVNHNPRLTTLPGTLADCQQLRVLDASNTAISALPSALGRLEQIRVLAIEATPLENKWIAKHVLLLRPKRSDTLSAVDDTDTPVPAVTAPSSALSDEQSTITPCHRILRELRRKDERVRIKAELRDKLRFTMYRLDRSDMQAATSIDAMVRRVTKLFPLATDLRTLVRNAERFLPRSFSAAAMTQVDPVAVRKAFDALADENDRKKRTADLELKLRAIYFDRIDPTAVEDIIQRIYPHVPLLADVKFLISHAAALLPANPADVDGAVIKQKIQQLQHELASERQAALDKLLIAVKAVYSDTEPDQVQLLVAQVAALFKACHFVVVGWLVS